MSSNLNVVLKVVKRVSVLEQIKVDIKRLVKSKIQPKLNSENNSKQYTCSTPWYDKTFSKKFNFTRHESVCRRPSNNSAICYLCKKRIFQALKFAKTFTNSF